MTRLTPKRLSIALIACAIASSALADTATDINAANALVREGKYDEALEIYRGVTPTDAVSDELDYNLAVAQYHKGDIAAARRLFSEVSTSADAKLASAAQYNLGNCSYADALVAADKDKPAAIELLKQAIEDYRGSLAGEPTNVDARANIELARELIKKLQEPKEQDQQQQEQQQQDQQQQDQQQQDQQQQDQQQDQQNQDTESQNNESQQDQQQQGQGQENHDQKNQGSESQDNQSREQQDEQDPSNSDQRQSGSDDQQSQQNQAQSESGKPQEPQDQSAQDGQPKPDQPAQEDAGQQRLQDRQQPAQHDQTPASSASETEQAEANEQPVPSGQLKAASEQEPNEKPDGRVAMSDPSVKDELMSKEEALKMLQAVRDRDMLRRLRQEQIERRMRIATDKDW